MISMGVFLGASTKIVDRASGEVIYGRVPAYSVVVPGTLPGKDGGPGLACAVIVKTVDAQNPVEDGDQRIAEGLRAVRAGLWLALLLAASPAAAQPAPPAHGPLTYDELRALPDEALTRRLFGALAPDIVLSIRPDWPSRPLALRRASHLGVDTPAPLLGAGLCETDRSILYFRAGLSEERRGSRKSGDAPRPDRDQDLLYRPRPRPRRRAYAARSGASRRLGGRLRRARSPARRRSRGLSPSVDAGLCAGQRARRGRPRRTGACAARLQPHALERAAARRRGRVPARAARLGQSFGGLGQRVPRHCGPRPIASASSPARSSSTSA